MKPESLDLLIDIAKLLKKHGAEAFSNLSIELRSDLFRENLTDLLDTTAKVGIAKDLDRPQNRQPIFSRKSLSLLSQKEPEKAQLLQIFYDSLNAKSVLPTLKDIQMFAIELGLPDIKANGRKKATPSLMRALMTVPLEDLKKKLLPLMSNLNYNDRSLEGWSNLIIKKRDTEH